MVKLVWNSCVHHESESNIMSRCQGHEPTPVCRLTKPFTVLFLSLDRYGTLMSRRSPGTTTIETPRLRTKYKYHTPKRDPTKNQRRDTVLALYQNSIILFLYGCNVWCLCTKISMIFDFEKKQNAVKFGHFFSHCY